MLLKPLIINALDIKGGAAKAAYRLHRGLTHLGLESRMLVQSKTGHDKDVIALSGRMAKLEGKYRPGLDARLAGVIAGSTDKDFYPALIPFSRIRNQIESLSPEIINLHWINGGMFKIEELALLLQPLVWTLHDMWPFTGGCSYTESCRRYLQTCGNCPKLKRSSDHDLSYRGFVRKKATYSSMSITIVSPSHWLADRARESSLLGNYRIEVIPNGLDLQIYTPKDRSDARRALNLSENIPLILFGAVSATSDRRKGYDLLQKALSSLRQSGFETANLLVFGADSSEGDQELHFPVTYLGQVTDENELAKLYSAADVTVVPSRADNLPNVAVESLACGTPVVAFDTGGLRDIVEHQSNGYLAQAENPEALSEGIYWVLEDPVRRKLLSVQARKTAETKFSLELQAQRYRDLYQSVLRD